MASPPVDRQQTLFSGCASRDAAAQLALILSSEDKGIGSTAEQEGSEAATNAPGVEGGGLNGTKGHDVGVLCGVGGRLLLL